MDGREAVRAAYQLYYQRLVVAVYGLTGNLAEAQDTVQETFARALSRRRQFLTVESPEAWLRTTAVNLVRTRWRRRQLWNTLVRAGRIQPTSASVPGIGPDRVALVTAMQRLPRPVRETLVLHYMADMKVDEIAAQLNVAAGTVKARLSRGRTALAALLDEHADDRLPLPAVTEEPRHA